MELINCQEVPITELEAAGVTGASVELGLPDDPAERAEQFVFVGNVQAVRVPDPVIVMKQNDNDAFSYILVYVHQDGTAYRMLFSLNVGDRNKIRKLHDHRENAARRTLRVQILIALRRHLARPT